jgi:hypothetical protein
MLDTTPLGLYKCKDEPGDSGGPIVAGDEDEEEWSPLTPPLMHHHHHHNPAALTLGPSQGGAAGLTAELDPLA